MKAELPAHWHKQLPRFAADPKGTATRVSSGTVLNKIATTITNLFGGSADLAPSNKTLIDGETDFQPDNYAGRNLRFGVREHAMGAVLNGMALHGGLIPYGGTFLVFSDYMRPAIRLAALSRLKVIYVFTHDSIGLGEDGPTHQPIEQLAALRAIPNLTIIRPCDANETAHAWQVALQSQNGPVALVLTRQSVPTLDRKQFSAADGLHRGAYILSEPPNKKPDIILLASGSEVALALQGSEKLETHGIAARVVSMPSWELFEAQSKDYRLKVLPTDIRARLAIEAGSPIGWHRYVGDCGQILALDHFGASAPYTVLYDNFGLTSDRLAEKALALVRDLDK
jgi:transketolase